MLSLIFHTLCGQNVKRLATEDLEHTAGVGSDLWCHQMVRGARGISHSHKVAIIKMKKTLRRLFCQQRSHPLARVYHTEGEAAAITLTKEEPLSPVCFYAGEDAARPRPGRAASTSLTASGGVPPPSSFPVIHRSLSLNIPWPSRMSPCPPVSGHVKLTHISASALCN